jgi:hypothetical protein
VKEVKKELTWILEKLEEAGITFMGKSKEPEFFLVS